MDMWIDSSLRSIFKQADPASVLLVCGDQIPPGAEAFDSAPAHRTLTRTNATEISHGNRELAVHELAIIADTLEHLDHETGLELIGTIRNRFAKRIFLALDEPAGKDSIWRDTDFFSLGMRKASAPEDSERRLRIYTYDLDSYNFRRSWNNARNWANPQNFGKYWW